MMLMPAVYLKTDPILACVPNVNDTLLEVNVFVKEIVRWDAFYQFAFLAFFLFPSADIGVIDDDNNAIFAESFQFRHDKCFGGWIERSHGLIN